MKKSPLLESTLRPGGIILQTILSKTGNWKNRLRTVVAGISTFLLAGCMGYPETLSPVGNFEIDRYLGRWYEIARLDHSFERGLVQVSADYALREDGGVSVTNRGFSREKNTWNEAVGKAYFVNEPDEGYLKVSFFGPFYSSYVIFEMDQEEYEYAFVSGANNSYLWLLARTPRVSEGVKKRFVDTAQKRGFAVEELIWVEQR
jgi:apolipoprotein D and lipocalin family protein